jgi:formylglycine-generating enzyme required for sulfatase activity
MFQVTKKSIVLFFLTGLFSLPLSAQRTIPFRLPDSGQTNDYTSSDGEDSDLLINPPSFTDNGEGTITDNNTLMMWQKTDGGEMTFENAIQYCQDLSLAGYNDWRLPTSIELFSINNYNNLNPALDSNYFTITPAQYWWTSETQADDPAKVWVVNAGGGIGAHPKTETVSAGGTKLFHARAVRAAVSVVSSGSRFTDIGDGAIKDNYTGLRWQKIQSPDLMTWDEALGYAEGFSLAGKSDWRLPTVKELQSLNDVTKFKPSVDNDYFPNIQAGNFWTSTTLVQNPARAWEMNVDYGIVSYTDKADPENVLLVRGGMDNSDLGISETKIPGGEYEMGDHNGHYDPSHPDDEIPVHPVRIDSLTMATTETTNGQFLAFLNSSLLSGSIQVDNNWVHFTGDTNTLYYTFQDASFYSISFDGTAFSMADFRSNHPVNGVMWIGAAAYCNWLSTQNGLQECYDLGTFDCDFTKNGYRLPTEAEWEYAARSGHTDPYLKYPYGNTVDIAQANLPGSGDPYETGAYPFTTPVGFYDGTLKLKTDFNWPGNAASFQTSDGMNGFGLYDVQGNVWEFVNDWYGQNYYSSSTYDNPTGPDSGSIMPDGKPYRGMRGGNWYNGIDSNNVNDGHSRVSNRDPSYFRGPQDPNHPWYHVGFRVARKYSATTGLNDQSNGTDGDVPRLRNFPNPFTGSTTLLYYIPMPGHAILVIRTMLGMEIARLVDTEVSAGWHEVRWDPGPAGWGLYFCTLSNGPGQATIKLMHSK